MKRYNYKNLKIQNVALEIAKNISYILEQFPTYERYDLNSKMSRCSVSLTCNIAEGSARSNKSFSHFINIALGSSLDRTLNY